MPIIAEKLSNGIRFTISGALCQRISNWESELDELVFNEQLETGSFRGRWKVDDDLLEMMQWAKAQGAVIPYFGVGGSGGACVYTLKLGVTGYTIRVEHTVVGGSVEFSDDANAAEDAETVVPRIVFKIDGQEYENLQEWKHWAEEQALTSRYVYRFGRVSLGRLGYTVEVDDTVTKEKIDVTDYEDW